LGKDDQADELMFRPRCYSIRKSVNLHCDPSTLSLHVVLAGGQAEVIGAELSDV